MQAQSPHTSLWGVFPGHWARPFGLSFFLVFLLLPVEGKAQRINAGGSNYTDSGENVWTADRAYVPGSFGHIGGSSYSTTAAIAGTSDPALYQANRHESSFEYRFDLPNGTYQVRLRFAEIFSSTFGVGQRVFNVSLNGIAVLSNFDVYALVGPNTALDRTFTVTVTTGVLHINFVGVVRHAEVNAVEVVSAN